MYCNTVDKTLLTATSIKWPRAPFSRRNEGLCIVTQYTYMQVNFVLEKAMAEKSLK